METRRIGLLNVSVVGLGCNNFGWRLDAERTAAVVQAALDADITFFDTADMYGGTRSEEFLGRALGRRREGVVVATKFGMEVDERRRGARPEYVRQAVEDSLRRLGTDRIDLYQLHQPDPTTPIADTLGALDELVRAGKVREIGCSNFSASELRIAQEVVRPGAARFVSVQNEYNLLHREPEGAVISECLRAGLSFIPYFPLASGLLTGKYRQGQSPPPGSRLQSQFGTEPFTEANLLLVEALLRFAASRGRTLVELAVSWLASRPTVASVITGATSPEQVRSNATAAGWPFTDAELAEVEAILSQPVQASGSQKRRFMMKIALIGATGFVGSAILKEALDRGHEVTAIVRHPEKTPPHAKLRPQKGDVYNSDEVARLVAGHDAVVSAFNPGWKTPNLYADQVRGTTAIFAAVKKAGIKRVLWVGGAGSLEVKPGVQSVDLPEFPKEWKQGSLATREALNLLRKEPSLDWSFLSPSADLSPGQRTGKFRLGTDQLLKDAKGESRISVEDYAVAMIDELEKPTHIRQRFTVGY
jgi:aryl-alcohol dehydrogenase-like predicted oxidoreductase/putative NADH-flavin reductase